MNVDFKSTSTTHADAAVLLGVEVEQVGCLQERGWEQVLRASHRGLLVRGEDALQRGENGERVRQERHAGGDPDGVVCAQRGALRLEALLVRGEHAVDGLAVKVELRPLVRGAHHVLVRLQAHHRQVLVARRAGVAPQHVAAGVLLHGAAQARAERQEVRGEGGEVGAHAGALAAPQKGLVEAAGLAELVQEIAVAREGEREKRVKGIRRCHEKKIIYKRN